MLRRECSFHYARWSVRRVSLFVFCVWRSVGALFRCEHMESVFFMRAYWAFRGTLHNSSLKKSKVSEHCDTKIIINDDTTKLIFAHFPTGESDLNCFIYNAIRNLILNSLGLESFPNSSNKEKKSHATSRYTATVGLYLIYKKIDHYGHDFQSHLAFQSEVGTIDLLELCELPLLPCI